MAKNKNNKKQSAQNKQSNSSSNSGDGSDFAPNHNANKQSMGPNTNR